MGGRREGGKEGRGEGGREGRGKGGKGEVRRAAVAVGEDVLQGGNGGVGDVHHHNAATYCLVATTSCTL